MIPTVQRRILNPYRGRTILITGGRGYVGSALASRLSLVPCRLILLDRSSGPRWLPRSTASQVVHAVGDVGDLRVWKRCLPGVDLVFHMVGREPAAGRAGTMPDFRVNALPVIQMLETCRCSGLRPRIVFASSANLFGEVSVLPVNENGADNPLIPWSLHKLVAEHYLNIYRRNHRIPSVSLRLTNIYGPGGRPASNLRVILNRMIASALKGGPLVLYPNSDCLRDYLYIEDAISALLLAGTSDQVIDGHRFFVIGSGERHSIGGVWRLIARLVGKHLARKVRCHVDSSVKPSAFEMRQFTADARRFQQATGWNVQTTLEEGLNFTLKALL